MRKEDLWPSSWGSAIFSGEWISCWNSSALHEAGASAYSVSLHQSLHHCKPTARSPQLAGSEVGMGGQSHSWHEPGRTASGCSELQFSFPSGIAVGIACPELTWHRVNTIVLSKSPVWGRGKSSASEFESYKYSPTIQGNVNLNKPFTFSGPCIYLFLFI